MSKTYIKEETMTTWSTELKSINQECLTNISELEKELRELENSYQGNYADEYTASYKTFIEEIKNKHEDLSDFSAFLNKIYESINNE